MWIQNSSYGVYRYGAPKNILIKAIKEKVSKDSLEKKYSEYRRFKAYLGIEPLLDELLSPYFLIKYN